MASALPQLSPAVEAPEEEYEVSPQIEATIPFVKPEQNEASPKPNRLTKAPSSPAMRSPHLKTPLDMRRSTPVTIKIANGTSPLTGSRPSTRPSSRRFSGDIELEKLSVNNVLEIFDTGSRRPSALDILSHTGSEGAAGGSSLLKCR